MTKILAVLVGVLALLLLGTTAQAKPAPPPAPYVPAYEIVTFDQLVTPGGSGIREAQCPASKSVTGGGHWTDMPPQQAWTLVTSESRPNAANQSWQVKFHLDPSTPFNPVTLTIYAVCANTQ